ncbi:diacylglycerol/lipid kinase family protein [Trichococcus pasteurii]|uniref:Diacylglycerol/lipid kinase n=1 Tax=Trichococcus pasteurii TaxID=43064 RepID=A0A1W1IBJ0_9LACT|nr:diacylglycerol kinase family protein [Trichococcus pasteurii]SFE22632.1 lipid kinase, YegS/Rv2252/BmrU family [Trichococcus pasteurii]SLM50372.1 diacylglycerol/lipid kinase [Trichococcus pasteurii]SSB91253.1 diacylglycerol/lipid kinase [Trichococcus pasteurii]
MGICTLIVNPSSGGEKATGYLDLMKAQLSKMFEEVTVKETEKQGDAMQFAHEAANKGHEAVFCMGGDGTVNETVNGLASAGKNVSFGFVPLGTVNDLARAIGIPLEPEQAISMLGDAALVDLDIGKVNDRYFVSNVAAGAIPEAVEEVSVEQKTKYGPLAYFMEAGKALTSQTMHRFRFTVDGETFTQESPLVLIALTNSIASFENFMPQAKVDDGKMRMVVFKEFNLLDSLRLLPQLIMGEIRNSDTVIYMSFEQATITLEDGDSLITNVDGDEGPAFPLEIEILPSFIKVYGPAAT